MKKKQKLTKLQKKRKVWDIFIFTVMIFLGIIFILPFIWMIVVTFEGKANLVPPVPPKFYIDNPSLFNLKLVMEGGGLVNAYLNSFIVAVCATAVNLFSVLLAGYAFSKGRFRGKALMMAVILGTMMIPFESRMIPMFSMFNKLGMVNSLQALIWPALVDGFGVFMAKQYFDKLPDSLRESARVDGMNEYRIFACIYLPLAGPITSTLGILAFLNNWNNFLWPLVVITDANKRTIPLFISSFSMENASRSMGTTMAVGFMAIIPVIIIYLFLQKYIIESIATSGVKG